MKIDEDFNLNSFFEQINNGINDFSRKIKKYEIIERKGKTLIVFDACGISKEDISISIEKGNNFYTETYLVVSARTFNVELDKTYSINEKIPINTEFYEEINYEVKNGLLIVELIDKIPNTNIKINRK